MLSYLVLLAFACEVALIARCLRSPRPQAELARLRAFRSRTVRDLRGVSLFHRINAR